MSINVNDEVKVVSNNGGDSAMMIGYTGKVIRLYDLSTPIAIVKFNNGITAKIPVNDLIKVETQVNQENKIPEGAKRITKAEFMDAVLKVTVPDKIIEKVDLEKGMLVGLAAFAGGAKFAERLFKDAEAIVITKDQLIHEITNSVTDEYPKFTIVALMNGIILRGIVDVIFSDGSENA